MIFWTALRDSDFEIVEWPADRRRLDFGIGIEEDDWLTVEAWIMQPKIVWQQTMADGSS